MLMGCSSSRKSGKDKHLKTSEIFSSPDSEGEGLNFIQRKFQNDIQFYAVGNEPFWSLDINTNLFIRFNVMDSISMNLPAVKPILSDNGQTLLYYTKLQQQQLIIEMDPVECIDNMSGKVFSHTVSIEAIDGTNKNVYVTGCGMYVPDFRLNDKFTLAAINGREIDISAFGKNPPNIVFDFEEMRVYGSGGCNGFGGQFKFKGQQEIAIGALHSTLKACDNMDIETKMYSILQNGTFSFDISNAGTLKMYNGADVLVFRRAD
jgi:heat shock protein HslJ/uncharacterized membrane protein